MKTPKTGQPFMIDTPAGPVIVTKMPMLWDYPNGWDYDYHKRRIEHAERHGQSTEGMAQPEIGKPSGPKFKSLYKVEFEGLTRGWIVSLNGWGKPWALYRPMQLEFLSFWQEEPRERWWDNCGKINGIALCAAARTKKAGGRDALAALVPELVAAGELPTCEEAIAKLAAVKAERHAKRISEVSASLERLDRSIEDANTSAANLKDQAEALAAILEKTRGQLRNYETDTLTAVVEERQKLAEESEHRAAQLSERKARDEAALDDLQKGQS